MSLFTTQVLKNDSASLTVVQCEDKKNSSHFEHSPHTAAADREQKRLKFTRSGGKTGPGVDELVKEGNYSVVQGVLTTSDNLVHVCFTKNVLTK